MSEFKILKIKIHSFLVLLVFLSLCLYEFQTAAQYNLGAFWRGALSLFAQQAKLADDTLTNTHRRENDSFSQSVSISGSVLVVGSPSQDFDASGANAKINAGAAYVFTRSGTTWSLQQKLVASGTNGRMDADKFGYGVSVSGDTIAVGAPLQDYDASGANSLDAAGAVYVFTRSGTTWSLQQKIVGSGTNGRMASDLFGNIVSLDTNTLAVSAGGQNYDASGANSLSAAGAAYIFTRTGTTWSLQQKLVGSGTNGRMVNDSFSESGISLSGDTVVVSARAQDYDAAGANSLSSAGAAYVFTRSGTTWSLQQKLVDTGPNGRISGEEFANSVSISGNTVVVGVLEQDYDATGANSLTNAGAAYVFTRSGTTWSLQQKLVGSGTNGRMANDNFGTYVSVAGDFVAISAPLQDYNATGASSLTNAGAVYVYGRSGTTWSLHQKLVGSGTNGRILGDGFGEVVANTVTEVVVSSLAQSYDASGANSLTSAGAAYTYTRSGATWSLQQKLVGTGALTRIPGDYFSGSVSVSGDTMMIGASRHDYDASNINFFDDAGAVYVYTRNGTAWNFQQKLVGSGSNGRSTGDYFGYSVSLDANTAAVGAYQQDYDALGSNFSSLAGAVYIFTRTGTTWSLQQKLAGEGTNGRNAGDFFGYSVSLNQNTVAIGAYAQDYDAAGGALVSSAGAAYIFTRTGTAWSLQQKLVAEGNNGRMANDFFGRSISLNQNTVVVGSISQDYDASGANSLTDAGAAYIFTRTGTAWSLQQKLVGEGTNGRMAGDYFGRSLSLNQDTVVIGVEYQSYDASGANSLSSAGAVYVFTRSGTTWSLQQKLVGSGTNGRVASDQFGNSVSLKGQTLAVGAKGQDYDAVGASPLSNAGAAYVYIRGGGGSWNLQQKLSSTGTNARVTSDYFGQSISLDGNILVIGADNQSYDTTGANSAAQKGATYIFRRP